MEPGKNPLRSLTLWAAFSLIVVQWVIPGAEQWISGHSKHFVQMLGILIAGLRLKTDQPLQITFNFSLWGKK